MKDEEEEEVEEKKEAMKYQAYYKNNLSTSVVSVSAQKLCVWWKCNVENVG